MAVSSFTKPLPTPRVRSACCIYKVFPPSLKVSPLVSGLQRVLKIYRGVSRCRTSVNYFYLGEGLNLASLSYHIADLPKYVSQSQNPYDFARSGDKQRLVMAHH